MRERHFSIFVLAVALSTVIKIRPSAVPSNIEIVGFRLGPNGKSPDVSLRAGSLMSNWQVCRLIFGNWLRISTIGFLWARRLKICYPRAAEKRPSEEDGKLVHGGFQIEVTLKDLAKHIALSQPLELDGDVIGRGVALRVDDLAWALPEERCHTIL